MISRRNIRVKVMQSLYALHQSHTPIQPGLAQNVLQKHFDATGGLLIFLMYHLVEAARYAETDARMRASKHLPNEADMNVPVKIAGNTLLWRLYESTTYTSGLAKHKPQLIANPEWVRKIYQSLYDSTLYAIYNQTEGRDKKAEREIIEYIFTDLMLANEDFVAYVEDAFNNWDDDADMLRLLILHFFQKPGTFVIDNLVGKEKHDFAVNLLQTVLEKREMLDEIIKPRLRNWDPERLAQLDFILIEMGICEFLFFETIPIKVTINEYIDLGKEYSTQQSGQFINGILDNIRKELENQNRISKVSFAK